MSGRECSLIGALLSAAVLCLVLNSLGAARGEVAMVCTTSTDEQMAAARQQIEADDAYVVTTDRLGRTAIRFKIPVVLGDDTYLAVLSRRQQAFVYRGLYHSELRFNLDDKFIDDEGYDNLEFFILDFTYKRICHWYGELGFPFWRPEAVIEVEFLLRRVFDQDGLGRTYDVTIR